MFEGPRFYAAKHKDGKVRQNSRSGGVFTAITDWCLDQGGVIYGCVEDAPLNAHHTRATTKAERDAMRGSKYIQSRIGDSYKQALQDLNIGKLVVFSGTLCQISALRAFLGKEYDNLLCVDIVCHGVPSGKVIEEYVKWQCQGNECIHVDYRDKNNYDWEKHFVTLKYKDGAKGEVLSTSSNVFSNLYYGHCMLRPSCYKCPYKSVERSSDITIADYWGIDEFAPGFNDHRGVSLIIIDSEKGEKWFGFAKDELDLMESTKEKSLQPPLISAFEKPDEYYMFWDDFKCRPFRYVAGKYGDYHSWIGWKWIGLKRKLRLI